MLIIYRRYNARRTHAAEEKEDEALYHPHQ
jgi:hypothetical protein